MKKPFMQIASDGVHEIIVEGVISSEMWWGDEFTPDMVRDELDQLNGEPVRVIINSPGGEVFAGVAIYNALLSYTGRKTVRVDGVAASMASVIAMVGDEIYMSPGSTMMVHKPLVGAYGNVEDLKKAIDLLDAIEESISPIYEKRTGLSKAEIADLLAAETWMSADKAVELGFADKLETDEEPVNAFDKIKVMLKNEQFAFSMSAMHKSLEEYVDAPKGESEVKTDETKKVETAEIKPEETVVTEEVTKTEEVATEVETEVETEEATAEEAAVEEEVTEPIATETKKPVNKVNMNKLAKDAVIPAAVEVAEVKAVQDTSITMKEYKTRFVEMLSSAYNGDKDAATAQADSLKAEMVINGTTGEPLYGSEVLANDIRTAYSNVGRVGALVNRIDIEGAETFKQLVETAGAGFRPVALGGVKQEDQPVWTPVSFEPHEFALIVAWLDGVQKRSPIAIYNQIVRYIAQEYAKLEDKIVLTWTGGTFGGETFPSTGVVPALTTASRVVPVTDYQAQYVIPAIGEAFGLIESDQTLTLVANRATWGALATTIDGEGRAVFSVVGSQVAAGALGTFNVVLSEVLADGDVVFGAFDDYNLVTRGSLATLFSREATVGELNLFTQDASALRADIDITGGAVEIKSFALLQIDGASS